MPKLPPVRIAAEQPLPVELQSKPGDPAELHIELLQLAAEANASGYSDLTQSWRSLETKAQGTAAVAGIFLAGAFAFARDVGTKLNDPAVVLLALATVLLVSAASFALLAQRIRLMPTSPSTLLLNNWVTLVRKDPPPLQREALIPLYEEFNKNWRTTNDGLLKIINHKGKHLRIAQLLLLLAAIAITAVTILSLVSQHPKHPNERSTTNAKLSNVRTGYSRGDVLSSALRHEYDSRNGRGGARPSA